MMVLVLYERKLQYLIKFSTLFISISILYRLQLSCVSGHKRANDALRHALLKGKKFNNVQSLALILYNLTMEACL